MVEPNKRAVKCSEVWLREVQMGRSEVSTGVVKWSEGLRNRVCIIIRRYAADHMKFAASFIFF